tara:strand:+ start:2566 stop:3909 length:1344 start_codon:yes stop_codon:yes gene_type:complete
MKFKICIIFLLSLLVFDGVSQNDKVDSLLKVVRALKVERLNHTSAVEFNSTVEILLSEPEFFQYALDSVKDNFLFKARRVSKDYKLCIYSWDNFNGGSSSDVTSYIAYKGLNPIFEVFKSYESSLSAYYYKIETFVFKNRTFYMLLGGGSNGGGTKYYMVRVFEDSKTHIRECLELYPNQKNIVIEVNRNANPNIEFNAKEFILKYKKFDFDGNMGFYKKSFKQMNFNFADSISKKSVRMHTASNYYFPNLSLATELELVERNHLFEKDSLSSIEKIRLDSLIEKYDETYESVWNVMEAGCSWYCGGGNYKIVSSKNSEAVLANDFSYKTSWLSDSLNNGIGSYLDYHFEYKSPRIHTIIVSNGFFESDSLWRYHNRVKSLKVFVNEVPFGILKLDDLKSNQSFKIGVVDYENNKDLVFRFEILEVYHGISKRTAITEITFDGVDVH